MGKLAYEVQIFRYSAESFFGTSTKAVHIGFRYLEEKFWACHKSVLPIAFDQAMFTELQ
jgi:hypothetical protein